MGLLKGCSLKKNKSKGDCCDEKPRCDPCDPCGFDCEPPCPDPCSKPACCKPGCSPKKPCISCIRCGVKPEMCRRAPKRTCPLAKSCLKDGVCPRESNRIIKIKSKCVIEKNNDDDCCDEDESGDLDVNITINGNGCDRPDCCTPSCEPDPCCVPKCCPPKPKCCETPTCKCCQPPPCPEPCPCPKPKCGRPATPGKCCPKPKCPEPCSKPKCKKLQPCSCDECGSSVRFSDRDEVIPCKSDCRKTPKSCKKPGCPQPECPKPECPKPECPPCTPAIPCLLPTCDQPQCCANESNTTSIFLSDATGSYQSACLPPPPPFYMPNMTKCWSNPVPCPCGSASCRNAMMIFP